MRLPVSSIGYPDPDISLLFPSSARLNTLFARLTDLPFDTYPGDSEMNRLSRIFQSELNEMDQAKTARHLHMENRDGADVVLEKYLRQLPPIKIGIVKFRAANQQRPSSKKPLMKIRESERDTIGSDEQVGSIEIRCADRHETKLNRPVAERRRRCCSLVRARGSDCAAPFQHLSCAAGTTTGEFVLSLFRNTMREMPTDGSFIELFHVTFLDGNRASRALAETCAEPIAVHLAHEPRFAINYLERSLGARGNTGATSVTLLLINPNYLSTH
jgi:hypothetical protein